MRTMRCLGCFIALLAGLAMPAMAQASDQDAFARLRDLPEIPAVPQVASPDGRFVLRAVEAADRARGRRLDLVLETTATGGRVSVTPIHRSVAIGWRPDGERYFVNADLGPAAADCEVHDAIGAHPALSLADAVDFARLFEREKALDHLYFSCVRWTRQDEIEVVIHGHASRPNARPFRTRHLLWNLETGNFRPVK